MCTVLDWEAEGLHLGQGSTGLDNVDAFASVTLQRDALVLQRSTSVAYEGTDRDGSLLLQRRGERLPNIGVAPPASASACVAEGRKCHLVQRNTGLFDVDAIKKVMLQCFVSVAY